MSAGPPQSSSRRPGGAAATLPGVHRFCRIAQHEEQSTDNRQVAGENPAAATKHTGRSSVGRVPASEAGGRWIVTSRPDQFKNYGDRGVVALHRAP